MFWNIAVSLHGCVVVVLVVVGRGPWYRSSNAYCFKFKNEHR